MSEGVKVPLAEITAERLRKEDRAALLDLHRHLHGLAALGQVRDGCDTLTQAHELVAADIVRRGYRHGSPLECGKKMAGLYLVEPHAYLIWKGKKTAVAKSPEFYRQYGDKVVDVPLVLVSNDEAYGVVTLGTPAVMTPEQFDLPEYYEEHRVRPEERRAWWPDADRLYVYPVVDFQPYKQPLPVEVPQGVQNYIAEVAFKAYRPPTEREAQVLRQSEKLPKTIVLQPHAVSLTGSVLYGKHEPADVDLVLVGAEWRADEERFVVPLSPTFKEKLERVLKAVYQTGNQVQYISEGAGATFDHLPLYSLALVRLPRLEIERVSELEPEFAEVGYDKPGSKALSASALERKLRGASAEVRRQAKQTYDENEVIPGRMVLSLKPLRPAPQGERQTLDVFLKYIDEHLKFPLYVSAKRDGVTHYAHSDGKRVWLYSDDGADNTDLMPHLVEAFKQTFKGKSFVFGCEIERWVDSKHYPREAAAGDVKKGEDADLACNIFLTVYYDGKDLHEMPFQEVYDGVTSKLPHDSFTDGALHPQKDGPINIVPHYLVDSLDELKRKVEQVAYKSGVEGVVVTRPDGGFPLSGEPDTSLPEEIKWHKAMSFTGVCLDSEPTKTEGVSVHWFGLPVED